MTWRKTQLHAGPTPSPGRLSGTRPLAHARGAPRVPAPQPAAVTLPGRGHSLAQRSLR